MRKIFRGNSPLPTILPPAAPVFFDRFNCSKEQISYLRMFLFIPLKSASLLFQPLCGEVSISNMSTHQPAWHLFKASAEQSIVSFGCADCLQSAQRMMPLFRTFYSFMQWAVLPYICRNRGSTRQEGACLPGTADWWGAAQPHQPAL